MDKTLFFIPLLLLIPLSTYATDQTVSLDKIFGHNMNFSLADRLIILNNDTNFSHSFNAINKDGYTRSTPSIFPESSYTIQFEQAGNYTVIDGMNNGNIGYINVIDEQPKMITSTQNIIPMFSISNATTPQNITPVFSTSNATNITDTISSISNPTITQLQSTPLDSTGDALYWKAQAQTYRFLAEQYYQQLQQYINK